MSPGCLPCEGRPEWVGVGVGCLPVQCVLSGPVLELVGTLHVPSTVSLARAGPQHLFAKLKEEQRCEFTPCSCLKNSRESTLDKAFALNVTNIL